MTAAGGQRRYGDPCGVARSLNVLGDRWALLVIRDLLLGPKRFTDLLEGLPGASPNMITQRLSDLTGAGVVRRRKLPAPAQAWVYELTPGRGRDLRPVLLHLGRWGSSLPYQSDRRVLGHDSLVLGLEATWDTGRAASLNGTYELWIDHEAFTLSVEGTALSATRGPATRPDAVIRTDSRTFTEIVIRHLPVQAALASGQLTITGDTTAASRAAALITPAMT